jgi:alkylation response protein AidB-like acyl-CoA dehydrogenase
VSADERLARIRAVADEVLFPAAIEVDRSGEVPASHWQRLADDGLYGLADPALGLELPEIVEGIELMAGGCLATAFTWFQHHGVVFSLTFSENAALRELLLADLTSGRKRAGVAVAAVLAEPPRVHATRVEGGWSLTGDIPFVSGWGVIDMCQVSGVDDEDHVVSGILAAESQPGIAAVHPVDLVAADATATVRIQLDGLVVPDDRVTSRTPRQVFLDNQVFGIRLNGAVPLGLVRRCARLLRDAGADEAAGAFEAEADAVRAQLDAGMADPSALLLARAEGSQLAVRAASALVAAVGAPALDRDHHAQRLAREAIFTLVASSRPTMRQALVDLAYRDR